MHLCGHYGITLTWAYHALNQVVLLRVICQRYLDREMLGKEWEYWTREPMFSTAQASSLTGSSMVDQGWPRRQFRPIHAPVCVPRGHVQQGRCGISHWWTARRIS